MTTVVILPLPAIEKEIKHLHALLKTLPDDLPLSTGHYNFSDYAPDPENVDDYGDDGAVNRDLEVTFCPGGRIDGPLTFRERGPGLEAISGTLWHYIQKYPQNVVLQKWVFDLIDAAKVLEPVSSTDEP